MAAALAASLASSMAQNVYSLNVVGYVNVTLPPGHFYCVANPLDATMGGTVANGNAMTNLFKTATANLANGSFFNTFIPSLSDYSPTVPTYNGKNGTWSGNFSMPPGVGAAMFYNNGAVDTVVTFTGQVPQGTYSAGTLVGNHFNMVGSPIPIGGDLTNSTTAVGLVPANGDLAQTFNSSISDWRPSVSWSAKNHVWNGPMPVGVGQGFLYYNNGATANNWVSNFTVN